MITIKGIVISSRETNENDRYVSIITDELGVIDFLARGARKISSKNNAATQLFAYSRFCLNESKGRYYLDSSETVSIFYGIRNDLKKVALASYFAELVKYAVMSLQPEEEIMRLLLNTFHFLAEDTFSCEQLKSIFELRFACCVGFRPRLVGCKKCYMYESDRMFFILEDGSLLCGKHYGIFYSAEGEEFFPVTAELSKTLLHIMRTVCLTELDRVFSFRVTGKSLEQLNDITEYYLLEKLDRKFGTLDFYNDLKDLEYE